MHAGYFYSMHAGYFYMLFGLLMIFFQNNYFRKFYQFPDTFVFKEENSAEKKFLNYSLDQDGFLLDLDPNCLQRLSADKKKH